MLTIIYVLTFPNSMHAFQWGTSKVFKNKAHIKAVFGLGLTWCGIRTVRKRASHCSMWWKCGLPALVSSPYPVNGDAASPEELGKVNWNNILEEAGIYEALNEYSLNRRGYGWKFKRSGFLGTQFSEDSELWKRVICYSCHVITTHHWPESVFLHWSR